MESYAKIIRLSELQKREILTTYINGVKKALNEVQLKKLIKDELNKFIPQHNEEEFQTIYEDCKLYVVLKDLFSIYKNNEELILGKEFAIKVAKDYIIDQYLSMDIDELEEKGIIEDIVNRLAKTDFSSIHNKMIKKDIILFLQNKLNIKTDLTEEEVCELFKNKDRYLLFLRIYVEKLIKRGKYEIPKEDVEKEQSQDPITSKYLDNYLKRIEERDEIRRKLLVSDDEAKQLIKKDFLAIDIAENNIFNLDGTRRISNSLVEDKLLTMYLETR